MARLQYLAHREKFPWDDEEFDATNNQGSRSVEQRGAVASSTGQPVTALLNFFSPARGQTVVNTAAVAPAPPPAARARLTTRACLARIEGDWRDAAKHDAAL